MPDSTAQKMVEATQEPLQVELGGLHDSAYWSPDFQRNIILASLRALLEAGPSDGMVSAAWDNGWVATRDEDFSRWFKAMLSALISEIEQDTQKS